MILHCLHKTVLKCMCIGRPLLAHINNTVILNNVVLIFLSTWRSKMNCGNLWIGFIIRPYRVILSLFVSWRCCAGEDIAVRLLLQCWIHEYAKILKAKSEIFTGWTRFTYLQEIQEARFGSTGLSHHCHCSAEVVHILTVSVQHHGLGKLLRNSVLFCFFRIIDNMMV